jgi:hypothetical protein
MGVEELREVKQAHRIFLCLAKCPTTGRYCPEEFLTESGEVRHEAKAKHNFPSFDSNSELILQAVALVVWLLLAESNERYSFCYD